MKKFGSVLLVMVMAVTCLVSFTACNNDTETECVANDAGDLLQEDFGIIVNASDSALLEAVNNVINKWLKDGTMDKYIVYYDKVDAAEKADKEIPKAPEGLKTEWDFGDATEEILVYTEAGFAPFEFIFGEDIIGVDVAIMSEVCENLGKKINVENVNFDNISTNVENAKQNAVGAAGISITDERKSNPAFTFSTPYYKSTLVILSDKSKNYKNVADLKGLTVGVQEGTSGDDILTKAGMDDGYTYTIIEDGKEKDINIKVSNVEIMRYKSYALVYADLKAGRINAILMDKLPAMSLLKTIA